jgi:tryptophan synthase alpha chain
VSRVAGARRLEEALGAARRQGRAGLVPFLTAGDPDPEESLSRLKAAAAHADVLEVGVPFSDPVADGPTLQRAATRALAAGVGVEASLELVRRLRRDHPVPVALLTYVNPVLAWGVDRFFAEAAAAGVDGAVIPDLPLEESASLRAAAHRQGVALIPFAAPTTGDARLRALAEVAEGFVYCVAVLGVTGVRGRLSDRVAPLLERVRRVTPVPAVVGFGISGAEAAAAAAAAGADGVILGSALADALEGLRGEAAMRAVADLLGPVRAALDLSQAAGRGAG